MNQTQVLILVFLTLYLSVAAIAFLKAVPKGKLQFDYLFVGCLHLFSAVVVAMLAVWG